MNLSNETVLLRITAVKIGFHWITVVIFIPSSGSPSELWCELPPRKPKFLPPPPALLNLNLTATTMNSRLVQVPYGLAVARIKTIGRTKVNDKIHIFLRTYVTLYCFSPYFDYRYLHRENKPLLAGAAGLSWLFVLLVVKTPTTTPW